MPFLAPGTMPPPIHYSLCAERTPESRWFEDDPGASTSATRYPIHEIRIGFTCYPLRASVEGFWIPGHSDIGEFRVNGFSPRFVGRGDASHDAERDWRDQVHRVFQDLYGKRAFEMSEAELSTWRLLEDLIDVVAYRNSTPLCVREVGRVSRARPQPRRITWIDGRNEQVDLEDMPGPFAAYKPGQWFEAQVERDWATGTLKRVLSVQAIRPIQRMSEERLSEFLSGLHGTSELPDSDESWT